MKEPKASNNQKRKGKKTIEIVVYRNGILVDNKFNDYNIGNGKKILEMLRKNEIYADLLSDRGDNEEYVNVEVFEKDEEYFDCGEAAAFREIEIKRCGRKLRELKRVDTIPSEIVIDKGGDLFKVIVNGSKTLVTMDGIKKLTELRTFLAQFYGEGEAILSLGGKRIEWNTLVREVRHNLVVITFQ